MTTITPEFAEVWKCFSESLRPPPIESTREFSEKYRVLHPIYCAENPGPWSNSVFPYQPGWMDAGDEAIAEGKNLCGMKAGQIGGSDTCINIELKFKRDFPGPHLFLTSTEKVAEEFGRERFNEIIPDMPPLAARYIPNPRGSILVKRFVDGKIELCGGQSVFNLQSTPYRCVVIDEMDSLADNLRGAGDPLKLAEIRTDSFGGETLIIAYAHPSTKERGVGKLYYEQSDQRRGFIRHKCGGEFWIDWFNPDCIVVKPRLDGQTQEQARKEPDCYQFHCPCCHARISEEERVGMLRSGVVQKSTLPPDEAKKKKWVGVHASQLYTPHKTIRAFAERLIGALDDPNAMRVFVNKVLGDVFEPKVKEIDIDNLRSLIVVRRRPNDREFYSRGTVPPAVVFLTGGQDSRSTQLHHVVWGWGVRIATDKTRWLCGWLIDWGEIERKYSLLFNDAEYHIYDDLIYRRRFKSTIANASYHVRSCAHDIGYQPTQMPIIRYCRSWPGRAVPARGASETPTSATKADYVRMGAAKRFNAGEAEQIDDPAMLINTYLLKEQWYSWVDQRIEIDEFEHGEKVGTRKVPRLSLPEDVDETWLEQSKNEKLARGKRPRELVWVKSGPNHLADCNTYAFGCAMYLEPHMGNMTAEEFRQTQMVRRRASYSRPSERPDPSMG